MIGIDTNILIRIFVRDDVRQADRATRLLDESAPGALLINVVVLVEFAWTTRRIFKWYDDEMRRALTTIVRHPALLIQHRDSVLEAISNSSIGMSHFADRLIGALNRDEGCETTFTFDKDAAKSTGFKELTT